MSSGGSPGSQQQCHQHSLESTAASVKCNVTNSSERGYESTHFPSPALRPLSPTWERLCVITFYTPWHYLNTPSIPSPSRSSLHTYMPGLCLLCLAGVIERHGSASETRAPRMVRRPAESVCGERVREAVQTHTCPKHRARVSKNKEAIPSRARGTGSHPQTNRVEGRAPLPGEGDDPAVREK